MTFTVDRRIAELLCSRICHELVAGVAAINNGVELISEIDPSMFEEAMELIGSSAKQASARVQYYRMAYGFAGYDALSSMAAVGELVSGLIATESRYSVELPRAVSPPLQAGWGKLLLNLLVMGMECLPRGGTVVPAVVAAEGKAIVSVIARGDEARVPDRYREVLEGTIALEAVSALNVHAFYTAALAGAVGRGIDIDIDGGTAILRVSA
jgi:histidine phosphotransferase ChpT